MSKKILPILLLVVIAAGCSVKRDAVGEPDQLIVVADTSDWMQWKSQIQKVFAPMIPTPRPEPWYQIKRVPPADFDQFTAFRNIIIFSTLREESPSKQLIDRLFSRSLVSSMEAGEQPVATKTNPWRNSQFMLILTTPSKVEMETILTKRGDELRGYFDTEFNKRQTKYLYKRYEQVKLEKRFQHDYNWTFRVPRDWVIVHERPDSNFVWIGRNLPNRWFSVYWEKVDSSVVVDSALAVHLREKVATEQYKNISTNEDYLQTEYINIDGQPAVRLQGIWARTTEAKGGPFTGAAYYDPDTKRLFYLDGQVFAPDLKKLLYLRQEEIMVSTFTSGSTPKRLQ